VRVLPARIGHVVRRGPGFLDPWDDLAPNRAIGVVSLDQVKKMGRDGESELGAGEENAAAFFIRQLQVLLELGERRHPIFQLPFPVIPKLRRNVRPVARRMRDELFSIHFTRGKSEHFSFCGPKS
jgi:hypothetical protein